MLIDTLGVRVLGTAEVLPARVVTTAEVAALCGVDAHLAVERTGVHTRRWLSPDEDPLDLGVTAALAALEDAGLTVDDVDVVLGASATPLQGMPDGGALVAAGLRLRDGVAYSLQGSCISFLFALREAGFLIDSGRAQHVLVVSTEAGSRLLDPAQPESALLIGDAAAAVVLGPAIEAGQGIVTSAFRTRASGASDAEIRGLGTRGAGSPPRDGRLDLRGRRLIGGALTDLPPFLESLRPGLTQGADGIDRILPLPASRACLEMFARFWGRDRTVDTLGELGNTMAASLPVALHRAEIKPEETLLLVGSGAGCHHGAMILRA